MGDEEADGTPADRGNSGLVQRLTYGILAALAVLGGMVWGCQHEWRLIVVGVALALICRGWLLLFNGAVYLGALWATQRAGADRLRRVWLVVVGTLILNSVIIALWTYVIHVVLMAATESRPSWPLVLWLLGITVYPLKSMNGGYAPGCKTKIAYAAVGSFLGLLAVDGLLPDVPAGRLAILAVGAVAYLMWAFRAASAYHKTQVQALSRRLASPAPIGAPR